MNEQALYTHDQQACYPCFLTNMCFTVLLNEKEAFALVGTIFPYDGVQKI